MTTTASSSEIKKIPHQAPESVTSPITTANPTSDGREFDGKKQAVCAQQEPCITLNKRTRYRPPEIVLQYLRIQQENRCYYHLATCTGPVEVAAHLCHNPPCRNPKHLVGSCDRCNKVLSDKARPAKTWYANQPVRVRDSDPVSRMPGDRTASESRHELGWPKFVDYAKNTLDKVDSFPYEDFVRNSAKLAKVSVYTVVHRWIPREDNIYGFLKVFRNGRGGVKQVSLNRDIVEEDYEN